MDVAAWLRRLGLEQYAQLFRDNDIDGEILCGMTAEDLKELGISSFGHRRRLLNAITALGGEPPTRDAAQSATSVTSALTSLPPIEAERRQLTVMFCDLVGSTALSRQTDPEDLNALIGAYHRAAAEQVGRCGGYVAKYMGDGVLSYFGYPQAHEDDAALAIQAGLAILDAVPGFAAPAATAATAQQPQVRIGVATGLVIVGELIGEGTAQERNVVGETPNLAARLQSLADPGTLVIAETTHRLAGGLFEYRDLGAVNLKGFAEPVPVWQVLRPSAVESRFEALRAGDLTPLVGREEELDLLLRRWQRAAAGEGQVVLLSGEPGIGKSRLTAALREQLEGEPHTRLRYFCSPHHQDSALHPFIAQLERAAGFAHDDTPEQKLGKLAALVAPGARDRDEVTLIADLLSLLPSAAAELDLTPQRQREKLLAALLHQLEALAGQQPVLMVVEDLHWIDPSSRELLDLMIERAARLPMLLILTFRPEFQPPWSGLPQVAALTLNRLDRRNGTLMVERIAGNRKLPDALAAEIVERADGVPLFVEELTRAVIEAGPGGEALAGAMPLPPSGVPPALHASLVARLDRLGPTAREAAQIGAVLGREFPYELIARVAQPRAQADLQAALGALTGAGLLFCRGAAPRSSYLFKHALIQDAAYETLLRARRQELHRTAAQTIAADFPTLAETQPEVIARHWSGAGNAERAFAAWRKAGQVARSRNALIEAREAYRRALDMLDLTAPSPEHDATELELLIATNQVVAATQGYASPDVVEINSRAAALAAKTGNLGHLAEQIFGSWRAAFIAGNHPSAMALADRLLDVARRDGGAFTRGLATDVQQVTRIYIGDLLGAEKHFVSGEPFLSDQSLRWYYTNRTIFYAGWNAWLTGRADEARARMRRAVAAIEDDVYARAIVQFFSSSLHVTLREPEQAAVLAAQAIATAAEHGFRDYGWWARMCHGWAQAQLGRPDEGASLIRQALTACRANGSLTAFTLFLTFLAEAQALGGALAESLRTLEEALTVNPDERFWRPETLRVRGEIRRQQGEEKLAEADFRAAIALAREMSAKAWELRAATSLARLWRDQGRRAEARALLALVYGWFTEGFDTPDLNEAKALLEELT
jgi:class 3 adenylate cyclase/tetratricopeptide (TPR) repeat protein